MARRNKIAPEDLEEKKKKFEQIAGDLEIVPTDKFLKDNFLPYAWSFNLDRALVDVSGLKPVQRRILYTLYKDGLTPNSNRSKVATLAGRVLAYHPHGDSSVVDALKNLAREHIFRVPLIDGKGDFGVPGTPGAAARYIEARLNKAAWLNVEEIGENAVHMVANYDGSTTEPVKIPVKWPVSLINGGSGIAMAYASSMPSHNPTEVMNACKALLENPELTDDELAEIVLGPDFNMGGLVTSNDGIKDYLKTGKGSFKIRGQYEVKPTTRSAYRIEFYEIPFGTYPEQIIENIQKQISEKGNLKEIASYKDLSDLKHPIRIVIETKPSVNYRKVIQDLFKYTNLETTFSANITTIVDNKPQQSSMRALILDFVEFRKVCIRKKSSYSLGKKEERLHLVEGLMKTLLNIDKAISIIRSSDNIDVARDELMKAFSIDEKQADYVLSLQLRRLTKMDKIELENEKKTLEDEISYLNSLISDDEVLRKHLLNEFDETLKVIGDERKTEVLNMTAEDFANSEKIVTKELRKDTKSLPCFVTRFANGTVVKTDEAFVYPTLSKKFAHSPIVEQIKVKTQDSILLVGSNGVAYTIPLSYLPTGEVMTPGKTGVVFGKDVNLVAIAKTSVLKTDVGLVLATEKGDAKLVKPDFPAKEEFVVFSLSDGDKIVDGKWLGRTLTGSSFVSITDGGNVLIYDGTSLRPTGASAGGVKSQRLREGEKVIHFNWVPSVKDAATYIISQSQLTVKLTPINDIPPKSKGAQGVALHKFKKGEVSLTKAFVGSNPIMDLEGTGNAIPLPPASRRAAAGVDFTLKTSMGSSEVTAM